MTTIHCISFFYKILPIACTQAGTLQLYHKCRTQHKDKTVHIGLGNMPDPCHDRSVNGIPTNIHFHSQMAVSQVFHLLLYILSQCPWTSWSHSILLQRELSVYYLNCVQKKKKKNLLNRALQICPEYISLCRRMIVCKSRPAKSHSFVERCSQLEKCLKLCILP